MALRAGYYGVKRALKDELVEIAGAWDATIESLFPRSEQAELGAINVLRRFKGNDTINGVSFTVGDDDVVTLSESTATGYVSYDYAGRNSRQLKIPVGTWKIIPRKTGSDDSRFVIGSGNTTDGTGGTYEEWVRCSDEPVTFTVDATKSNRYITAAIVLNQGKSANSTWQPMIVPANFPDDVNYSNALTNQELTASAADQKTAINAIISAATGAADFAAFKAAMEAITPVTRSLSMVAAPEEIVKDEIEEPVVEKKTTTRKKSTAKADTQEEV